MTLLIAFIALLLSHESACETRHASSPFVVPAPSPYVVLPLPIPQPPYQSPLPQYWSPAVEFGRQPRKEKILLDEIVYGVFAPRTFNGTWLSDDELMYRDSLGNLVVMNVSSSEEAPKMIVANYTFVSCDELRSS